jgi:hypothetical protein
VSSCLVRASRVRPSWRGPMSAAVMVDCAVAAAVSRPVDRVQFDTAIADERP